MRIAFYAPMKPPDHPVASGDRRVARLFIRALEMKGHQVFLASRLVSRDGGGDPLRQARLQALGARLADRLIRRFGRKRRDERPQLWFTYHLYYKAPDYIGPRVAKALGIPYLVAEASVSAKRAGGPWDLGHRATLEALKRACGAVTLNPNDAGCLDPALPQLLLPPFLDPVPYRAARAERERHRREIAQRHRLDAAPTWLLCVAMMRGGAKLESYRVLARALSLLADKTWRLLAAGDGPARGEVTTAFREAGLGEERVAWLGALSGEALPAFYAAADLLLWPAINEAYGMALLEAQAAGLPVVAGRVGGVPAVVLDGESGTLTPPGDAVAFAAAVASLLEDKARRERMGEAAAERIAERQSLAASAERLDAFLREHCGP